MAHVSSSTPTASNGRRRQPNTLPGGVYVPIVTPFKSNEDLDEVTLQTHCLRVANAGCGLVLMGTNGEASHMTRQERITCIRSVRSVVPESTPIIAGTGSGSLRETIQFTRDAAEAGADAVLVISPGYFSFVIGKDDKAHKEFFKWVILFKPA